MSRRATLRHQRRLRRTRPKNWCYVYALREIADGPPRYVGQTRCHPNERLRWHFKDIETRKQIGRKLSPVQRWIVDLVALGGSPVIDVLDADGKWDISEAVWIDRLRRDGAELLNVSSLVA
jgi:hypothetical protein